MAIYAPKDNGQVEVASLVKANQEKRDGEAEASLSSLAIDGKRYVVKYPFEEWTFTVENGAGTEEITKKVVIVND